MATLYGNPGNFRTQKVLAAAKYGNVQLKVVDSLPPSSKFPCPITPAYDAGKKQLFCANAIAWEVGGEKLHGQSKEHQSEVIQWMEAADTDFLPSVLGWVLPSVSVMQLEKKAFDDSKSELLKRLELLDGYMLSRTFLVGERLSVADLALAFDLLPAYETVLEPNTRKAFVNVNRWFNTVMHQPEVHAVVGEVKLCDQAAVHDAKKFKECQASAPAPRTTSESANDSQGESGGKKKKKKGKGKDSDTEQKEKKEEKKEDKKDSKKKKEEENGEAEEMDATEAALLEEPKQKDPFAALPKTTFNFDDFKRVYSNEETPKAIDYFWKNFDKEGCSIWYCEYLYPKELTMVFMSCNLITGMYQRLDKMRKHAFGSMILFGSDNNSTIAGVWVWRGQDLAFKLSPDLMVDYESYEWKKLDPTKDADKQTVNEFFLWEGKFGGKKFNQGKIFK